MQEVRMPKIGLSEADVTLGKWEKRTGDSVKKGEIIAVVQGEKLANEIESEMNGVMGEIFVKEGEIVPIGTLLAVIQK